jgi:FAD/FMN-containing dehydrogenase/Fe-S oxidoreductase
MDSSRLPASRLKALPVIHRHDVHGELRALGRDLQKVVEGEVRFDDQSLGLYATDSSNFRQVPLGVVVPKTLDDVVATHRICSSYGAPILNRGGGTSLSGETVNFAVVIDNSKYLRFIGDPDVERRLVTVHTGAVNEEVNKHTGKSNLVFGPDPSSHAYCTIGGNIGNNSCGIHSVQSQIYGPGPRTSDNVHEMEIVTYQGERFRVGVGEEPFLDGIIAAGGRKGEIYAKLRSLRDRYAKEIRARFAPVSQVPRRVSGFNLDELLPERGFNVARALVGTEGTCATALQVTLMLTPALLQRVTVVVAYDDICEACDHVPELIEWKPIGLEGLDHRLIVEQGKEHKHLSGQKLLPRYGSAKSGWLLVQFGADDAGEVRDRARRFCEWLVQKKGRPRDAVASYESDQLGGASEELWEIREGGLGATAFPPGGKDHWPGWEDSAVPPARVGAYIRDLRRLYGKYDLQGAMYGHFGQGCIHSRISFDMRSAGGLRRYRAFLNEAADLVVSYGGSLSGEHGDGQQRAEFLVKQYGPELVQAMREFKQIWDPDWKMNPGKVVEPYRVDQNLKLGVDYNPPRPPVKFAYQKDGGDFAHATVRCVGVGKCRKPQGDDVMCPSYIVTHEERHVTRGRARLLFEMLQGDVIRDGWQSKEVYEALDLCLACKGCTSECPVNVDMPTYKSEFLYHHYQSLRRWRKRYMYAFGFIDQAARLASLIPEVTNFVTQTRGLASVAKSLAGIDPHRRIPAFAPQTLQAWFRARGGSQVRSERKVVLWPDTFNNYFHTNVGVASVEALEAAGFEVLMPQQHVCCGRPLYDYGFLDVAQKYLRRTLRQLRREIRQGIPVVGMEPSCLAVFKDELKNILPHDDDAARLFRNAFHFPEFFARHDIPLPRLEGKAVVWGHCHHKATGGMGPELKLLKEKMGLDAQEAKGGCCGLAGSFGFEDGKYDISMKCGEVGLLPAARAADPQTLIIADGFSCKTQLEQSDVGRRALHTAEVMKLAREAALARGPQARPERLAPARPEPPRIVRVARTAVALTAVAVALGGVSFAVARIAGKHRRARGRLR